MKSNKTTHCLNCGTYIGETNFCHQCGQINSDKRITVRQILKDFFGDYFTLDSKFFRSLFPLLAKPGHLTREYVSGRRVRYVLPLRLYIFTTFVFFFVLALNTKLDTKAFTSKTEATDILASDSLKAMLSRPELAIPDEQKNALIDHMDSTFVIQYETEYSGPNLVFDPDDDDETESAFESYIENKADYIKSMGNQGKSIFFKTLINQIPKVMFVMLPFFALLLKLLYVRHKIYYVEHFIFALHMHTLAFLLLIITVFFTKWYIVLVVILGIQVYLLLSIRNFYDQGLIKSFIKMQLLLTLYFIALLPAVFLLLILAVVSI